MSPIEGLGQIIFQTFLTKGSYDLASLSVKEIYNRLKEVISEKNIEDISDEKLENIASNISNCIEAMKKEIEKENNSNLSYEDCYEIVIEKSLNDVENSTIDIEVMTLIMNKSGNRVKNSDISIKSKKH